MYYELLSDDRWSFLIDPENRGRQEGWMHEPPSDAVTISVPSCIEETHPYTDGVVWYWKTFRASQLPDDHFFRLCFEGVDYFAEAWLNGHYLGGVQSGLLPFLFEVTRALHPTDNLLSVRVIDPAHGTSVDGYQLGNVPGGKQHENPWSSGQPHYNYGGILQDVFLDGRNLQWIDDVYIQPNVEDSAIEVQVELGDRTGHMDSLTVEATVYPDYPEAGEPVARARRRVRIGKGRRDVHLSLFLPKMVRWEVHNAHLYRLNVTLFRDDELLDMRSERFGMRDVSFKDGRVTVNGRPILLRGFLYNQIWPITLGRPYGKMARRDIELAVDAGANLMRTFSKSPFRATLDACDEMGMLLQVETLAASQLTKGTVSSRARHLEDLMIRQVRRDRNRASVMWWCCLHDTTDEMLTYATQQLLPKIRMLDPTRVILNADNAEPEGCVQWLPDEPEPQQHFEQRHWYLFENVSPTEPVGHSRVASTTERVRQLRGRELMGKADPASKPFYLSEWGAPHGSEWGVLLETYSNHRDDLEDATLFRDLVEHHRQQYARLRLEERGFPTFDAFLTAGKRAAAKRYEEYLTALWGNPKAIGHCLTAFEDSGYAISGVVDIWRNQKVSSFQKIRELNSPSLLNVDWQPRTLYVGDPVNVDVSLVNEHELEAGNNVLSLSLQGPEQSTLWNVQEKVRVTGDLIQPLFAYPLKGASMGGPHRLTVVLRKEGAAEGQSEAVHVRNISVFERVPPRHIEVATPFVWESESKLSPMLDSIGVPSQPVSAPEHLNTNAPIIVTVGELNDDNMAMWKAVLAKWESGSPLIVLDHRIFADGDDLMAHFPAMDDWKPNPRLLSWDYGGARFITNHPMFTGLPQGCSVGSTDIYARLCPVDS
ncbi:MAG: hypothetical protein O3A46_05770 [Candidatus Poribacteria bacterium]|nr:hypothetical protein [Candidatus Poribacteria bacterium]